MARFSALTVNIPLMSGEAAGIMQDIKKWFQDFARFAYYLTGRVLGFVVVSGGDLLHEPFEVGPVERHRAIDQSVEQNAEGPVQFAVSRIE